MTNLAKYIKQSGGEVGGNMKYFKSKGGLCLYIIAAIIAITMAILGAYFLCNLICLLTVTGNSLFDWANKDE